jgi:4-amino-4-deoxy-L-arabinose transferase-like glycosyltransferase
LFSSIPLAFYQKYVDLKLHQLQGSSMLSAIIPLLFIVTLISYNVYWSRRMSRNPYLWAFLAVAFPVVSIWVLNRIGAGTYGWMTLPQYLEKYPQCNTGQGISCCNCGSRQIRSWGRSGIGDSSRLQSCNHCGMGLYHT